MGGSAGYALVFGFVQRRLLSNHCGVGFGRRVQDRSDGRLVSDLRFDGRKAVLIPPRPRDPSHVGTARGSRRAGDVIY
jgi:hypothetical protein